MIALITGSSKGIGLAIAKVFIKEGIEVILTGRNREELLTLQLELKSFNSQLRIWVHASDLSQRAGIPRAALRPGGGVRQQIPQQPLGRGREALRELRDVRVADL